MPSLTAAASKPPSCGLKPLTCQYAIADIAEMPVNDYGGFHDEDETVEQEFALKHKWTTSNSKVYTSTSAVGGIVLTFCSALLVSNKQAYGAGTFVFHIVGAVSWPALLFD